ncbi:MAG TPA: hypothetical protein VEJ63_17980 [Planctomycetota bacterium]|nr:hypothetical protein [Planctomycetota bacterium]
MLLALKLLLVPALIGCISLAGQKWGPRVGGILAGVPSVAGPILFFVTLDQGGAFAAQASAGILAGMFAFAAFCICYAQMCRRFHWSVCTLTGYAAFAALTLGLNELKPALPLAIGLAMVSLLLIRKLTPVVELISRDGSLTKVELLFRMATGAALVLILTQAADALGPRLSGLLTVFPTATTVLAVFSHRNQGPTHTIQMLRGMASGLYSFNAFFIVLALSVESWGLAAFAVAASVSVLCQVAVFRLSRPASAPVATKDISEALSEVR